MVAHAGTVASLGLEARSVDVQVQVSGDQPNFIIVGLPDKAVKESRTGHNRFGPDPLV